MAKHAVKIIIECASNILPLIHRKMNLIACHEFRWLILGQTDFFMEFDVHCYRSRLEIEIEPTS